jgi:hypothetical protein
VVVGRPPNVASSRSRAVGRECSRSGASSASWTRLGGAFTGGAPPDAALSLLPSRTLCRHLAMTTSRRSVPGANPIMGSGPARLSIAAAIPLDSNIVNHHDDDDDCDHDNRSSPMTC